MEVLFKAYRLLSMSSIVSGVSWCLIGFSEYTLKDTEHRETPITQASRPRSPYPELNEEMEPWHKRMQKRVSPKRPNL